MNNREKLIALISRHGLERADVAKMLKVKREQVDRWLLSTESRQREEAPEMAVELLLWKLKYPDEPAADWDEA